jgi:hypothetical protein
LRGSGNGILIKREKDQRFGVELKNQGDEKTGPSLHVPTFRSLTQTDKIGLSVSFADQIRTLPIGLSVAGPH